MKTLILALQLTAAVLSAAALSACESADLFVTSTLPDAGPVFVDIGGQKDTLRPDGGSPLPAQCASDLDCRVGTAPCMEAACVQALCVVTPKAANALCDDLDPCTVNTSCRSGACVGNNVCAEPVEFWPYYYVPPYPLQPSHAL